MTCGAFGLSIFYILFYFAELSTYHRHVIFHDGKIVSEITYGVIYSDFVYSW